MVLPPWMYLKMLLLMPLKVLENINWKSVRTLVLPFLFEPRPCVLRQLGQTWNYVLCVGITFYQSSELPFALGNTSLCLRIPAAVVACARPTFSLCDKQASWNQARMPLLEKWIRFGHHFSRTERKFSTVPVWQKSVSCCRSLVRFLSCTMVLSAVC